jgi:DnaJ-class molecular chaperone
MDGTRARSVLGVPTHATTREIDAAFRNQAKRLHPDLGSTSAGAFRHLVKARELMLDSAENRDGRRVVSSSIARRFDQQTTQSDSQRSRSDVARRVPTATRRIERRTFGHYLEEALAS